MRAKKWTSGPKLQACIEAHGLAWRVAEGQIPRDLLGSSPGDVCWSGAELLIERHCRREWVAHELAHFLVHRVEAPASCDAPNWGFDDDAFDPELKLELLAANVTVAILRRLRYPWRRAAWDMQLMNNLRHRPIVVSGMLPADWEQVRRQCEQVARPYMEQSSVFGGIQ